MRVHALRKIRTASSCCLRLGNTVVMSLLKNKNRTSMHFVHEDDNHRPLTAETRVRFVARSYDICGWQSGTRTGNPPPSNSAFPSIPFQQHSIIIIVFRLLRMTRKRSLGCPSYTEMDFWNSGELETELFSLFRGSKYQLTWNIWRGERVYRVCCS